MKKNQGYTKAEIIIIVLVLMVIGYIGYKNYVFGQKVSRDMQRRADIEEIQRRIESYYETYWEFPAELNFGHKLVDPFGKDYVYKDTNGIAEDLPSDPINKRPYIYTYETDKDHLIYKLCAEKLEVSGEKYCFEGDKRERFKKDVQELRENEGL